MTKAARIEDRGPTSIEQELRQLAKAEEQVAREEAALTSELAAVEQGVQQLAERIDKLQADYAQLKLAPAERLSPSLLPVVEVDQVLARGFSARTAAVSARSDVARELRELLTGYKQMLSRAAPAIAAGETQLKETLAEVARKAAQGPAAVPPPAPPPPEATEPPLAKLPTRTRTQSGVGAKTEPAMPAVAPPPARRVQPRVSMQAQVDLSSETNFFSGFSTNLSEGGLFVATVNMVPLGSEIDLSFSLPDGMVVKTTGTVKWTREVNDLQPEQMPGLGIQFNALDAAAAKAITQFVSSREPMFWAD